MIGHTAPQVKASPRLPFQFRPQPVAIGKLGLPIAAVQLFTILIDASKRRGWRTGLTNPELAALLNRTTRTITRLLSILEAHGLIVRELAANGRARSGIRITWDGVGNSRPVDERTVGQPRPTGAKFVSAEVGNLDPTYSEAPQSAFQTAGSPVSGDEQTKDEPRPSPAEVAAALRVIAAGQYAPMMFDAAKPEGSNAPAAATTPTTSPASEPTPKADAKIKPKPARPATPARAAKLEPHGGFDLRRVGVSAVAAAYSPKFGAVRNTPEQLAHQAANWRRLRANPSPAPPHGTAPPTTERPAILPNPPSRGALANPGKL